MSSIQRFKKLKNGEYKFEKNVTNYFGLSKNGEDNSDQEKEIDS